MVKTLKHEAKADFLLDKGMEILWAKGYNSTSVNDIVKAADVPKGSFYFYFKSKEDFAVQAIDRYFNLHFASSLDVLKEVGISAKERLLKFYQFRIDVLKEQLKCKMGCLGCNLSNEMSEHSEAIRTKVLNKGNMVMQHIVDVALEAQQDGDISAKINIPDIIAFIEDAGKGAMISMKERQDSYSIDNNIKITKYILFN